MAIASRLMPLGLCLAGLAHAAEPQRVAMLEISGAPVDQPGPLAWLAPAGEPTLRDYVSAIYAAADDASLDRVVLRLKDAELAGSQIDELATALRDLRASGKKVHFFAEAMGPAEFMLGAQADEVIVQKGGPVSLPGIAMEEMYLADTFSWLGLHADMLQVGDYKGANEMMTRAGPSPAWDENISGLLDAMYGEMRRKITEGRGIDDAALDAAMEDLWFATAEDAVRLGLADAAVDLDDLIAHIEGQAGEVQYAGDLPVGIEGPALDTANPFAMLAMLMQEPTVDATEPTIAVLHLAGPIVDGDSAAGGLTGSASVGSRTLRNAMQDIADDEEIRGVVVRIDSPGGSATASEMILLGLRRLAEVKPVWVSVGSMAASGGYYAAVGGQRIYVNPSSIVGSIGVVGGKISFGEFLGKGRVNVVVRSRGPRGQMFTAQTPWSDDEKSLLLGKLRETYDQFTARVREGRPGIDIERVAAGRLFLGADAVRLGMADEIGGLDDAIADLADELGMSGYEVMDFPAPQSLEEILSEAFGGLIRGPSVLAQAFEALEAVLGADRVRAVRAQFEALTHLRDQNVLLVSPRAVWFRF